MCPSIWGPLAKGALRLLTLSQSMLLAGTGGRLRQLCTYGGCSWKQIAWWAVGFSREGQSFGVWWGRDGTQRSGCICLNVPETHHLLLWVSLGKVICPGGMQKPWATLSMFSWASCRPVYQWTIPHDVAVGTTSISKAVWNLDKVYFFLSPSFPPSLFSSLSPALPASFLPSPDCEMNK